MDSESTLDFELNLEDIERENTDANIDTNSRLVSILRILCTPFSKFLTSLQRYSSNDSFQDLMDYAKKNRISYDDDEKMVKFYGQHLAQPVGEPIFESASEGYVKIKFGDGEERLYFTIDGPAEKTAEVA